MSADGLFSLANMMAYFFNGAQLSTLDFDVTIYLNMTGLSLGALYGGDFAAYEVGNIPIQAHAAQMVLDSSILRHFTNYSIESDRKTFPQYFNEDTAGDPFGGLNFVEFIAFIFLPYV